MTANKREEILSKAKPILFNTEMVRSILDGRKTVTRRVVKPQPKVDETGDITFRFRGCSSDFVQVSVTGLGGTLPCVPPCRLGDILYARETFCKGSLNYGANQYYYKADDKIPHCQWRPSIHMPKEAARIFLRVTNVSVAKLQDITEEQAIAEGCSAGAMEISGGSWGVEDGPEEWTAVEHFHSVWDSTIKPKDRPFYGWESNPWVWVIEFERID